jgi:hypothetical protein
MRRFFVLTITLFHIFGAIGVPVAAYTCVESGEVGVVGYLSGSAKSCYVDSCCESDETQASVYIQSETPCCDLDIHNAPENSRTLPPVHERGQANPLADAPARFDDSVSNVCITSTSSAVLVFHASINLPLLF